MVNLVAAGSGVAGRVCELNKQAGPTMPPPPPPGEVMFMREKFGREEGGLWGGEGGEEEG